MDYKDPMHRAVDHNISGIIQSFFQINDLNTIPDTDGVIEETYIKCITQRLYLLSLVHNCRNLLTIGVDAWLNALLHDFYERTKKVKIVDDENLETVRKKRVRISELNVLYDASSFCFDETESAVLNRIPCFDDILTNRELIDLNLTEFRKGFKHVQCEQIISDMTNAFNIELNTRRIPNVSTIESGKQKNLVGQKGFGPVSHNIQDSGLSYKHIGATMYNGKDYAQKSSTMNTHKVVNNLNIHTNPMREINTGEYSVRQDIQRVAREMKSYYTARQGLNTMSSMPVYSIPNQKIQPYQLPSHQIIAPRHSLQPNISPNQVQLHTLLHSEEQTQTKRRPLLYNNNQQLFFNAQIISQPQNKLIRQANMPPYHGMKYPQNTTPAIASDQNISFRIIQAKKQSSESNTNFKQPNCNHRQ